MEINRFIDVVYAGSAPTASDQYDFPYFYKNGTHGNVHIDPMTTPYTPCNALYLNSIGTTTKISVATKTSELNNTSVAINFNIFV